MKMSKNIDLYMCMYHRDMYFYESRRYVCVTEICMLEREGGCE